MIKPACDLQTVKPGKKSTLGFRQITSYLPEGFRQITSSCKETYPNLKYTKESLDIPSLSEENVIVQDIITLCKNFIHKQDVKRGDYKELAYLALLYLNDSETVDSFKSFLKPGTSQCKMDG